MASDVTGHSPLVELCLAEVSVAWGEANPEMRRRSQLASDTVSFVPTNGAPMSAPAGSQSRPAERPAAPAEHGGGFRPRSNRPLGGAIDEPALKSPHRGAAGMQPTMARGIGRTPAGLHRGEAGEAAPVAVVPAPGRIGGPRHRVEGVGNRTRQPRDRWSASRLHARSRALACSSPRADQAGTQLERRSAHFTPSRARRGSSGGPRCCHRPRRPGNSAIGGCRKAS